MCYSSESHAPNLTTHTTRDDDDDVSRYPPPPRSPSDAGPGDLLDLATLGLSHALYEEYASLGSDDAVERCGQLCGDVIEAEEAVKEAEAVLHERMRARDDAWVPLGQFLVVQRFTRPHEYAQLLLRVKQQQRDRVLEWLKNRNAASPPTDADVDEEFKRRWKAPMRYMNGALKL